MLSMDNLYLVLSSMEIIDLVLHPWEEAVFYVLIMSILSIKRISFFCFVSTQHGWFPSGQTE